LAKLWTKLAIVEIVKYQIFQMSVAQLSDATDI